MAVGKMYVSHEIDFIASTKLLKSKLKNELLQYVWCLDSYFLDSVPLPP